MKRKSEKDRNHDRYKSICKGVWEKQFDTRQSIDSMTVIQLQNLSIQAQHWVDKTKNCYELRIRHRNTYYKNRPDPNHEPPIRQAKAYNKLCEQFKDKVDNILETMASGLSPVEKNTYNNWTKPRSKKR